MSMNNASTVNEALITQMMSQLIDNTQTAHSKRKVSRLYWSILNNTALKSITEYTHVEAINPNDTDRIQHHGSTRITTTRRYKNAESNVAKALLTLRSIMGYKTAKFLVASRENMANDALYHAINDFKFKLNSDFFTLFNFEK